MIGENNRPVVVYTSIAPHNGLIANFIDYEPQRQLTLAPGRRGDRWEPPELRLDRTINGKKPSRTGDLYNTGMSTEYVVNARAREVLESVVQDDAEFLPVVGGDEPFWIMNTVRILPALDLDRSTLEEAPSRMEQHSWLLNKAIIPVFYGPLLENVATFRLPREQRILKSLFVTSKFVDAVKEHGLTGIDFDMVWTSDG